MGQFKGIARVAALAALLSSVTPHLPAFAQVTEGQVWIQIEAKNTLSGAEDRLRHWSSNLPDVTGFALASGWYGVALGPYTTTEAAAKLQELRDLRVIPSDSFIADPGIFRNQFWPAGAPAAPPPPAPNAEITAPTAPLTTLPNTTDPVAEPPIVPLETLADARSHEASLNREERMDIQRALQWSGVYASGIDGAFGPGTRGSIADWQNAQGFEATGVLTSTQRAQLVGAWRTEVEALGLELFRDQEAGIEAVLPLGLVAFDRYAPPFAQYAPKGDSGMQIWLISQPGDQAALEALYETLQSLAILPAEGPRSRRGRGFEISGQTAEVQTYAWAELNKGAIRGYLISNRSADSARATRILQSLKTSFRAIGDQVLDPGLIPLDEASKAGMISGIEMKKPERVGSGFFVDPQGMVMTAASLVESCTKITLDAGQEASILASDAALGYALLKPKVALAPRGVAQLAASLPTASSEISVAGFPFGVAYDLPAQTFGRYEAPSDLSGTEDRARVTLPSVEGDVGGPVIGADGLVIGVLQARSTDPARSLPAEVNHFLPAHKIGAALSTKGTALTLHPSIPGQMAAEDLSALGNAMAVQVSCWK